MYDVIVMGGGAAGYFCAINIGELNPSLKIAILEKSSKTLAKVKVSGGGRCNVAHAAYEPSLLVKHYPRGEKELLGPFYSFSTNNTIDFFEGRNISLKTEDDGRIFPVSNSSQTIIDCFEKEVKSKGIFLFKETTVVEIVNNYKEEDKIDSRWTLETNKGDFHCSNLVVCTGSSPKTWKTIESLGHTIVPPVPSLFTFNIKDKLIEDIPGLSTIAEVKLQINLFKSSRQKRRGNSFISSGPLLITHWGLSGPAILKLSAWAARELNECDYKFKIVVNWLPDLGINELFDSLNELRSKESKKTIYKTKAFGLPTRLWMKLVKSAGLSSEEKWAEISKLKLEKLCKQLSATEFNVNGKSTFKEEFVTAGGVELKEIDFKTFESKIHPSLYFAGEVLNIDAITGGFNFQNAWTGAYIAAKAIANTYLN